MVVMIMPRKVRRGAVGREHLYNRTTVRYLPPRNRTSVQIRRGTHMSATIQQIPTGTYALDPVHSTIGFGVKYNKLATYRSTFDKRDAQLADGVLTGSADASSVVIDEP